MSTEKVRNELETIYNGSEAKKTNTDIFTFFSKDFIYEYGPDFINDAIKEFFELSLRDEEMDKESLEDYKEEAKKYFEDEFTFQDEDDFNEMKEIIMSNIDSAEFGNDITNALEKLINSICVKSELVEEKKHVIKLKSFSEYMEERKKAKKEYYQSTPPWEESEWEQLETEAENYLWPPANNFHKDFDKMFKIADDYIFEYIEEVSSDKYQLLNTIWDIIDTRAYEGKEYKITSNEVESLLNMPMDKILDKMHEEIRYFVIDELLFNDKIEMSDIEKMSEY